jgi:hypothetical protein
MKERLVQKVEAGWSAASAPLRCAGLRSATAALESNCGGVCGAKGLQESIGESVGSGDFPNSAASTKDARRLRIVRHGLGTQLRLYLASLAVLVRRVLMKNVDPTLASGHEDQPRFRVVHLRIGAAADGND